MTDPSDDPGRPHDDAPPAETPPPVDDVPTVSCSRCEREWDLDRELGRVGTQAVEQFALDHERHTGHFPDGVATWCADCRNCPASAQRLDGDAARRWAETHARHTRHELDLHPADGGDPERIEP